MNALSVYDGHTSLFGMDGDTDPVRLSSTAVAKAVNRRFRGGKNLQRPPFREITLSFASPEDEQLFRYGNVQAAYPYLKTRAGRRDGLMLSIAGTIFYVALVNENGRVYRIMDGNNAKAMHAFFCQAEEWIYVQDGEHLPIFWNGLTLDDNQARRAVAADSEMPIGTIMAYAQGRIFVTNAYNQIVASDIMYGRGFTTTANVQKFTETTYWSEGGYFMLPSNFGTIAGAIVMPAYGANVRGQGELVIFGEDGAMSYDVGVPRQQWKDAQIVKVALSGRGCVSPNTLISVNGDAWFRSADGWDSYTNDRIDLSQKVAFRKFSREVNSYLDQDTPHLVRYASHVYFDNRILGTISPFVSLPRNTLLYGSHRYFRGMIALDLDQTSGLMGGGAMNFDGLWTGVRPTALVRVRDNAYAMSYDADGVNRLYEITKGVGNDNGNKKVDSFYVTKHFSFAPKSSEFSNKRLTGGELWVSEVGGRVTAALSYRADNSPCWNSLMPETSFGSDNPQVVGGLPFTRPWFKKWKTGSPDPDACQEGNDSLATNGSTIQIMVELNGNAKVDRMRVEAQSDPETNLSGDCEEDEKTPQPIQCRIEQDYKYLIVDGQSTITPTA